MKLGVIGAGTFGARHVQAYDRNMEVELSGICDPNIDKARALAATCSRSVPIFANAQDLLSVPDLVGVSVVTPDHLHTEVAVLAAENGKHLLIEKPLATTVEDARRIVRAAEHNGVTLMVDFANRAHPAFVNARAAVASGSVGEVKYVYARLSNTIPLVKSLNWAADSSSLWFLASHMIDIAQWITNSSVIGVTTRTVEGTLQGEGIDTPDIFVAMVEFENGALGVFEHSWILPASNPTVKDLKLEVQGSRGQVKIDGSHHRALEVYSEGLSYPELFAVPTGPHLTGFILDSITHFVDALMGRRPVIATGADGVQVTAAICAMLRSVETGLRESVPAVRNGIR